MLQNYLKNRFAAAGCIWLAEARAVDTMKDLDRGRRRQTLQNEAPRWAGRQGIWQRYILLALLEPTSAAAVFCV